MNISPFRRLLSRRVCSCPPLPHRPITTVRPTTRASSTSTAAAKHGAPYEYSVTRNADDLQRRWQPVPPSVQRERAERAYAFRRMRWSALGIFACSMCMLGAIYMYAGELPEVQEIRRRRRESRKHEPRTSLDSPPTLLSPDTSVPREVEQVPTGTSTVPTFPKTIQLSSLAAAAAAAASTSSITNSLPPEDYQLIGLGVRTVSFLSIQVYVVGLYVAVSDIATLQERLVRQIDNVATTLVAGEKNELRSLLLDPVKGEDVWNSILADGGIRTAFRIVPTRNTDFMHLRDGWVRGITTRTRHFASSAKKDQSFNDDAFGQSLNQFKAMWTGGGRVPKSETLLLTRDASGKMAAWYEDSKGSSVRLGEIDDERISRLIWLGYLGGKSVSSEPARQSIVDGCVELVERPVGTVEAQVV